jgi:hypothetical protein
MTHGELSAAALWLMLLLGAYHGLNPGMGWLFAVALGMQEQKSTTITRSLAPIALGHALAVGGAVAIAVLLGVTLPIEALRNIVATLLVGLGVFFLVKHWHPRWVRRLMVVPVLLRKGTAQAYGGGVTGHDYAHTAAAMSPVAALFATAVHTAGYLVVTALVAWIVYRKVGLAVLRKAWFNIDVLWAVALVATGVVTFLM